MDLRELEAVLLALGVNRLARGPAASDRQHAGHDDNGNRQAIASQVK